MDAVEFLIQRSRMCEEMGCLDCPFFPPDPDKPCFEDGHMPPEEAVRLVRLWAEAHPVEGKIGLSEDEQYLVRVYIDKGYLWAARDKDGSLRLYKREPKRREIAFVNTSPVVNGCRLVWGKSLFPGVTWEKSPVCLPKLLESEDKGRA